MQVSGLIIEFFDTGGTQILPFSSIGHQTDTRTEMLHIHHSTQVHVTIVSENAAGLISILYSDPVIVDLTPPDICCLKVIYVNYIDHRFSIKVYDLFILILWYFVYVCRMFLDNIPVLLLMSH